MEVRTLCVIGAGTMGTGIGQVAAQAEIVVHLLDNAEGSVARSQSLLQKNLQGGIDRGKITPEKADEIRQLLHWETNYDRLSEADWVIEAVFEDMAVKDSVLRQAATLVRDKVPVATNTSTFVVKELAASYGRPAHFLGMHFFNPPPAMKLVEVVPTEETLPEVTDAAFALCERMGKTPKLAPDIPGFVVDRAYGALAAASIEVWALGGDPEAIDSSIEMGLGHKMGPLRTADLVGLDVMLAVLRSLHQQTGHPRFEAPAKFIELVESGKLGRKSGEGFYRYGG
ncbi:MAG: 3-hydroxyacyl-CoA dehydrogenase family protein [Armatimonadetes bacterium]|nr:3-hydroxyacyl-CoA dehydrogenase family protein [Armatimonadota bacterium]